MSIPPKLARRMSKEAAAALHGIRGEKAMRFGLLRTLITLACFVGASVHASSQENSSGFEAPATAQQQMPDLIRRGLPGAGHETLDPLVGTWRVEMSLYVAGGSADDPIVSDDLICRREWVAGGRFLHDVTEGTLADGPYWRMGILGYSTMDERYEWVTADATNANMMIYFGKPGSGKEMPISMSGTFTDQGLIGEESTGKEVGQRTVISIENNDRHVIELYLTPPGEEEFLASRMVYTRMAE
jgi:hypothetical protein